MVHYFKFEMRMAGSLFEPQLCNFGKLDIFLIRSNDITTIFWNSLWGQTCQNVKSRCVQIIPRSTPYIIPLGGGDIMTPTPPIMNPSAVVTRWGLHQPKHLTLFHVCQVPGSQFWCWFFKKWKKIDVKNVWGSTIIRYESEINQRKFLFASLTYFLSSIWI